MNKGKAILNDRQLKVLYCIVKEYTKKGKPVSSNHILNHTSLDYSSATIRNDMRKLEYMGYIYQPHTSAGRIPTDSGIRFFIESIKNINKDLNDTNTNIAIKQTKRIGDIETLLRKMSNLLAKLTNSLVIISKPSFNKLLINSINIVNISEDYLNVTILTDLGVSKNISLFSNIEKARIQEYQSLINQIAVGKTTDELIQAINNFHLEKDKWYDSRLNDLIEFLNNILEISIDEKFYTNGTEYLLKNEYLSNSDILKVMNYLDNPNKLTDLFDIEYSDEEGKIFIGNEIDNEDLRNLAIFVAPYKKNENNIGNIAILDSKVVDYERVFGYLLYTANRISETFSNR
jgi:heat-inducible transcriptional repressor